MFCFISILWQPTFFHACVFLTAAFCFGREFDVTPLYYSGTYDLFFCESINMSKELRFVLFMGH